MFMDQCRGSRDPKISCHAETLLQMIWIKPPVRPKRDKWRIDGEPDFGRER
jgi:hypothetical protein